MKTKHIAIVLTHLSAELKALTCFGLVAFLLLNGEAETAVDVK